MKSCKGALARACCLAVALAAVFSPAGVAAPALPLSHAGRWITDARGRVVIVHGINMVYKVPPYYPAAVGFGADDAAFLQRIGFNAVRLGIIWKAVEPQPGVYDTTYVNQIARTVEILAGHGILALLDFHQDMYNELFQGEGAPDWAVQDDGLPPAPQAGFPQNYISMPALQHAYDHFWDNSPGPGGVGLQNRYAGAWRDVAARFAKTRSLLGYELFNEPFPGTVFGACASPTGCPLFDPKLTAFDRLIDAAIRNADQRTLVFYEPNVLFDFGAGTQVGALRDRRGGFAFHDYCFSSSPNGCPSEPVAFQNALAHVAQTHEALLLTEFGSNRYSADLGGMVRMADHYMVPWLEWSYCPCHDPTGATPDPLVLDPAKPPFGSNLGTFALGILVEPYPQVVAGTPLSWSYDRSSETFVLRYSTVRAGRRRRFAAWSVSEIATPRRVYGGHYAVSVRGGTVTSRRGASVLLIASCPGARTVTVTVRRSGATREGCRPPRG